MNPENGGEVFKAGSITFEYNETAQVMCTDIRRKTYISNLADKKERKI